MKKLLVVVLILSLCLALFACGEKNKNNDPTKEPAKETEPATIAVDPNSIAGKLAALGFNEADFLTESGAYFEVDDEGDFTLYTTATYAEVQELLFNACKKASDDGKVRDFWSEEEISFEVSEDFMIWYGYMRNGEFCDVALSETWANSDTGINEFFFQW